MTKKHRLLLCILSSLVAFGGFTVCGLSQPAARMLHKWYNGTIWIFMFFFISLMFMALRARLLRSAWVIPLCVLLSFPSASLAYLAYFGLFEPSRLLNALTQVGFFQFTFHASHPFTCNFSCLALRRSSGLAISNYEPHIAEMDAICRLAGEECIEC
jgi:hypothetical protein